MFKLRKILFSSTMVISMILLSSCFLSFNYSLKFTNGIFQSSEESIQDAIEKEYLLKNITISIEEIEPISECAEAKYDNSLFPNECKNIIRNYVDKKSIYVILPSMLEKNILVISLKEIDIIKEAYLRSIIFFLST